MRPRTHDRTPLPTAERIANGVVRVLAIHKSGKRSLALLRDTEFGKTYIGIVLFDAGGIDRVGVCLSVSDDFSDVAELLEMERMMRPARAPRYVG